MRVLLLGGTGAMGVSLKNILAGQGDEVYITSRSLHESNQDHIHYLQGDAHNAVFMEEVLKKHFDVIVDFMIYQSEEFEERSKMLLNATGQYVFTSSSRVYANSESPITEESPRLLDVCRDRTYLGTDEYALAKAREENVLFLSQKKNWTIIRPYITYNVERLQLGGIEKDIWLYRALHGRSIPFPQDVAIHQTTMTYGGDVAEMITMLIGNQTALGEAFHLTGTEHMAWEDILDIYLEVLDRVCNIRPRVLSPENSWQLSEKMGSIYQIKYDRLYDRIFDNSKFQRLCHGKESFVPMKDGLTRCLEEFLKTPVWKSTIYEELEAHLNKEAHDAMNLKELQGTKSRLKYLGWRYAPQMVRTIKKLKNISDKG